MSSSRRLQGSAVLLVVALALLVYSFADDRQFARTVSNIAQLARHGSQPSASHTPSLPGVAFRPAAPPGPSREEVLQVMNSYRERHGLRPLAVNAKLNAAADDRLRDMFVRRYFDHVAPDGTGPYVWVRRRGYRYAMVGENLAMGHDSAREVVDEWMRSPQHRANVLEKFEECGIAFAEGSPTGRTSGHTFVVLFAATSLSARSR